MPDSRYGQHDRGWQHRADEQRPHGDRRPRHIPIVVVIVSRHGPGSPAPQRFPAVTPRPVRAAANVATTTRIRLITPP